VKKDPAPVLIAALADAGIRAAGREVENRLAVLRRIPKLSHGGPGGDYLKPLVFHCHGEPFSLQAKILAAGGRSGRGKTRPVYRLEFLGNSQRLDTEKISGFKRAAGRALSTANKLGLSIGRAYDELLAAAAGTGWHVEEELSDLLVFNSPGEPRCVDVQIAVTRGGFRKGAARKKSYGIEFRNGSELPMTERKAELVREAEKALKAAARKGLPMSGAVSATSEAAAAAEWDRRPVTPAEGTGGPTPQARQDHPPGSNRATTPAGPPPCR
jgi:hypothetical protein